MQTRSYSSLGLAVRPRRDSGPGLRSLEIVVLQHTVHALHDWRASHVKETFVLFACHHHAPAAFAEPSAAMGFIRRENKISLEIATVSVCVF